MTDVIDAWTQDIHQGDCFEVLDELPEDSVHSVVTDPPYGLNFMGRDWDNFRRRRNEDDVGRDNVGGRLSATAPASGAETDMKRYQEWCEEWARECRRVLKPGGHLLAFSGNRTHHRLFTGVEDAGFEIRDTLTWHYGSGFPKATDVSKTIDKRADADREVVGEYEHPDGIARQWGEHDEEYQSYGESDGLTRREITEPATDAAKRWAGWKTGLKPATEFVVMARAPFDGATVDCVLEHGTGALNIAACRIGNEELERPPDRTFPNNTNRPDRDTLEREEGNVMDRHHGDMEGGTYEGRYPANVIFDETEAARLDREVGELDGRGGNTSVGFDGCVYGDNATDYNGEGTIFEASDGGPSRYFYTSKASRSERTEGGTIQNDHPTVKPQDLMEWLIKLVTREGQIVLDPFAGTGTTCKAAKALNREFIGIEQNEKWADVARVRCGLTPEDPSHVRADDAQTGMEAFTDGGDSGA